MQRVCLQIVIVVFPDHTHLLFCNPNTKKNKSKNQEQNVLKYIVYWAN